MKVRWSMVISTENVQREQKMTSFLFSCLGLFGKAPIGHHEWHGLQSSKDKIQ